MAWLSSVQDLVTWWGAARMGIFSSMKWFFIERAKDIAFLIATLLGRPDLWRNFWDTK
jgi:hypothetical protein